MMDLENGLLERPVENGRVVAFQSAFQDAITAYQDLLRSKASWDACKLARSPSYTRLLKAGQRMCWIGGESAVSKAARVIGNVVADGNAADFEYL